LLGREQADDALDLVAAPVQERQYLLPIEVGPTLVERYERGEVGLYLKCRLQGVSGGELMPLKRFSEQLWEVEVLSPLGRLDEPEHLVKRAGWNRCENGVKRAVSVGISDAMKKPKSLRVREVPSLVRLFSGNRPAITQAKVAEFGFKPLRLIRVTDISEDWELGVFGRPWPPPGLGESPGFSPDVPTREFPGQMVKRATRAIGEVSNEQRPYVGKVRRVEESHPCDSRLSTASGYFRLGLARDCVFLRTKLFPHLVLKDAEMFVCPPEFGERVI
jgi:hypothetical protein